MPLPPEHVLSAFHAETGATGTRRAQGDQLGPVWDNGIKAVSYTHLTLPTICSV